MLTNKTPLKRSQIKRMQKKIDFYRCEEGEKEIFNLMLDARMFDVCTEKELPLRNYAMAKLTELGFNQEDKIRKVIHELLAMPAVLNEADKNIDEEQEK